MCHPTRAIQLPMQKPTSAIMDLALVNAYLCGMIVRLVAMLGILAVTFVTMVSSAHAARMPAAMRQGQSMHVGMIVQPNDQNGPSCIRDQGCGMDDAAACMVLCSGLHAYTPIPFNLPDSVDPPVLHALPIVAIPAGGVPGLPERPPRLRLL